jgi:hypothetical protein
MGIRTDPAVTVPGVVPILVTLNVVHQGSVRDLTVVRYDRFDVIGLRKIYTFDKRFRVRIIETHREFRWVLSE